MYRGGGNEFVNEFTDAVIIGIPLHIDLQQRKRKM